MSTRKGFLPGREVALLASGLALLAAAVVLRKTGAVPAAPWLQYLVFGAAYVTVGWNVVAAAFRGIVRGRMFAESFLMTVATGGAFAIDQPTEAVAVMLFYKVGEIMQGLSVARSKRSIKALLDLRPDLARVLRAGALVEVRPETVEVGAEILVRPGERVPLDGTVTGGSGFVDTSALTGEPVPRRVAAGGQVLAGSISTDGTIQVRVDRPAGESSAAQIVRLVEEASHAKSRTDQFITRFARIYTPMVVVAAALIAIVPPLLVPGA
ncbi:MAG TPA: heavy metal translocating P-type ATPase, partial [Spirochaetia bacterium]|nr:heavy metal translocating P-type ATPase [Spirochaetia bacterium]